MKTTIMRPKLKPSFIFAFISCVLFWLGNYLQAILLSDEKFERKLAKKGRLIVRNLSFKVMQQNMSCV